MSARPPDGVQPRVWIVIGSILLTAVCSREALPTGGAPKATRTIDTLSAHFPPPTGCKAVPAAAGSFAAYARGLPLKPAGTKVHDHRGTVVEWGANLGAVLDIDLITSPRTTDLQQCADLAMRLWGEHHWAQKSAEELSFRLQNGQALAWKDWRRGVRGRVVGNRHVFSKVGATDTSYENFRAYLAYVMHWLGSAGIKTYASEVAPTDVQPGDLWVQNSSGAIGHVSILADVCHADGEALVLVVQSFMPAQEGHVVLPDRGEGVGAWFTLDGLQRHQSHFGPGVLRRLP